MKSHDKIWGDSTTKASMLVTFLQQIEDTEDFQGHRIMERGGVF